MKTHPLSRNGAHHGRFAAQAQLLVQPQVTRPSLVAVAALLLALLAMLLLANPASAQSGCVEGACLSTSTRLSTVDTQDSDLLNPLLAALLGDDTSLTLTLADYTALANANVTLGDLLAGLQADLSLATPEAVLTTNITLAQLQAVLNDLVPGNSGIGALLPVLSGVTGPIQLGELLDLSLAPASLDATSLNVLDLVVGSIQLFNSSNAVTVQEITIPGANAGIAGVDAVTLSARVVEPPQIVCGGEGSTFRSAGVRLILRVNVSDVLLPPTTVAGLPVGISATVGASLASFDLFVDVAPGSGTIQAINTVADSITLQATPGVANLYLGAIAPGADFFAADFDPATDLLSGTVGAMSGTITSTVPVASENFTGVVSLRAVALGSSAPQTVTLSAPLPVTTTVTAGGSSAANLVATLLANLGVDINLTLSPAFSALEAALEPLAEALVEDALDAADAFPTVIDDAATVLVDEILSQLGVGLGQMDIRVFGVNGDTDFANCPNLQVTIQHGGGLTLGQAAVFTVTVRNVGTAATSQPFSITTELLPELGFDNTTGSDAGWARTGTGTQPFVFTQSGVLQPNGETVLIINATPRQLGPVSVTVTGNAAGDDDPSNNSATFTGTVAPFSPADADGDGIPDATECPGGTNCPDTDGDGTPDNQDADSDGDGIRDDVECATGVPCTNTDGDGTPDYRDTDSDNDNVPDNIECPATAPCRDTDGDNKPDFRDTDDDNDNAPTAKECPDGPPCPEVGLPGLPDYLNPNYRKPDLYLPLVRNQAE